MSFRELKLFSEIMKSLGYGRLISLDNFRRPNFELVADILYFFCDRIESSIDLSDDISTKLKRVEFIKNCANILASKTQIKLKLKNLYKSDGYAVKELLKIANFLNEANNINEEEIEIEIEINNNIGTNLNKLREYTNLGSKIVESGVKIHNLLNNNNSDRHNSKIIDEKVIMFLDEMSHNIENYDNKIKKNIEKKLNHLINDIDDNLNDLEQDKLIEIKENIAIFQKKLNDKNSEYQRLNKRLLSLKNIKPAFIEEYEILESKNIEIYDLYTEKFRNLSYLQSELNKYRIIEYEKEMKTKKRLKSVQNKLREQELKLLTNNHDDVDDLDLFDANHRESGNYVSAASSMTNTNTNSASASASASASTSEMTSPQSMSRSNDRSIGSISDIGDERMQF